MSWRAIVGFRLVTHDLDRAVEFYRALGFSVQPPRRIAPEELAILGLAGGVRQTLRLGETFVDLDRYDELGRSYPGDATASSPCFQHFALVTTDVAAAWARAAAAGAWPISRDGPVTLPASSGGVTAMKFRDPDGHPLELLQFPGITGDGAVCRIDHSAIVATDLDASHAFYRGVGLTDGKGMLNTGDEQAALDGLDVPEVDVVPMQAAQAVPHLELLHYRRPTASSCGIVAPADIAATRIVWRANRAAMVRDPDGHFHQLEASASAGEIDREKAVAGGDE